MHAAGEMQQSLAQRVLAAGGALDITVGDQRVQDAMRGGRMQAGFGRERLETDRVGVLADDGEQGGNPVDDLDGGRGGFGHISLCGNDYVL